jgi:hypothetical protein
LVKGNPLIWVKHQILVKNHGLPVTVLFPLNSTGWWLTYPSEKYDFVSWDDDIPNIWKIKNMFQTTNQLNLNPSTQAS